MDDGHPATAPARFELSGGVLCLDFVNTWSNRADAASDRLASYPDLLAFAAESGVATPREAAALRRRAARHGAAAAAALQRARELREALYGLFSARAGGRPPARGDLLRVNAALGPALGELRVAARDHGYGWVWGPATDPLAAPLRPLARSAAELLVSPDLERVRECQAATCTWLFLDASRNRSRRWCSMESCGNRAKARRHYHRRRGGDA